MLSDTRLAIPHVQRQIDQRIDKREWLGMQCTVLLGGQVVLDIAAGEHLPGVPMTTGTGLRWTCSSKVATTILFAALESERIVDIDRPVDDYLPGFSATKQTTITCANLLNHSAGLAEEAEEPFLAPLGRVVARARDLGGQPDFRVGAERMYSSFANFAVLAAVAESATGRRFAELIDSYVFAPAGAVDTTFQPDRAQPDPTWIGNAGTLSPALGQLIPESARGAVLPGTGLVGPAGDLARVIRLLSPHSPDRPSAAARYVTRQAPFAPCRRSGDTAEWGLGVVVGWSRFGRCASDHTFGHAGCRSSLVLHDPGPDLTIAVISNTISTSLLRAERVKPFIPAIYADLGL
ncbi:MAG TPA: serine hydrolase domain-containing protein [Pseudonocardiaceae bacterium]|jgi:CubicO group peptidase (beta-lactamase class C family)|nr:serine hydrolase domain-containing protein [Pseudonocardiaceae bacterium]